MKIRTGRVFLNTLVEQTICVIGGDQSCWKYSPYLVSPYLLFHKSGRVFSEPFDAHV